MEDRIQRMKRVGSVLVEAGKAYYQESWEIMSNFEYDKLYDELVSLERKPGVTLSGSLSQQVGYEILSELPPRRPTVLPCFGQDEECGGFTGMAGRPEGAAVLEDGRPYHCAYL
ncbi:MAG: hypothetical protein ACLR0U_17725 [Enterocloster clostridioformis]